MSGDFRIELSTPPAWLVSRLDGAGGLPSLAEQVASRVKERKDLRPFREVMVDSAEDFANGARGHGSVVSAVRFDVTQDKDQTGLFAFLEVQARRLEGLGEGPERFGRIVDLASTADPGDEVTPIVATVEVGMGPAVRSEYVHTLADRGTLRMAVEYWIPVGDSADTAFLQFSHANLAATATFVPEYDFIADHLVVHRGL